jgi:hypothetical protein
MPGLYENTLVVYVSEDCYRVSGGYNLHRISSFGVV